MLKNLFHRETPYHQTSVEAESGLGATRRPVDRSWASAPWRAFIVALGLFVFAAPIGCGEGSGDPEPKVTSDTHEIMGEIFGAMRELLPLSVQTEELSNPSRRDQVASSIRTLSRNSGMLAAHVGGKDAQLQFLARSITADAHELERAYQEERFERAAFLLRNLTENCVVCHTRLSSEKDSPVTQGFIDEIVFDGLELEPRATLQIATRQFDSALDTLERLFASSISPVTMLGPLTDYLVVSIRVKRDYERPIPTLERFAVRPDLWTQLRAEVETWVEALPELKVRASGDPDVATARSLLGEARQMVDFPADRRWLAHLVVASDILERYIDSHPPPDPHLAEAYYLLGITEARIGRNYWVTPAPFLLETSIRMSNGESFAADAFALLEQELLMSYEGSDYEEIPADERVVLDELEAMLDLP
jgi:hypothetical protein